MKTLCLTLCLAIAAGTAVPAQEPAPPTPVPGAFASYTAGQLDQLLAPIALYPDALIAIILPAATVPADIVLAARYLQDANNNLSQVENRAWDDSVKSLTHYPEVLRWMDDNLDWTKQVGEAFATQPAEVMKSLQRLRARARAAGTLVDSPQQQVLVEPDVIRIVPTQSDVIFVPYYDSSLAYVESPGFYRPPSLTFGVGFPVGAWLAYDMDWRARRVWVGDRHRTWHKPDWNHPVVPIHEPGNTAGKWPVHPWQPPSHPYRPLVSTNFPPRNDVILPDSAPGTPRHSFPARTTNPATTPPVATQPGQPVTSAPPAFASNPYRFFPGSRGPVSDAANLATRTPPPLVQAPVVTTPPTTRQAGSEWAREFNSHNRQFPTAPANQGIAPVGPPSPPPSAPLPTATMNMGRQANPWPSHVAPPTPTASFPTATAPAPVAPPPPRAAPPANTPDTGNAREPRRGDRALQN